MAGGGPNPQGSRYTHNDSAFVEYNTRLQSNNLPTFTSAASRFAEWLSSDKAYYPNARDSIVSIVETAHANICRVQGDPSVPFKLDKALRGLDPWYQPYLSLLKQVGSHLNHFEPKLRARLQLLVENAEIKIVQVPTLTENTSPKPKTLSPTESTKDKRIPADASMQATVLSNQTQQPRPVSPVTNPEPPKKRRRKLNRAIFDVDTAAALKTKAQAEPSIVEAKNPPYSEVTIQQEVTGEVMPPDPLVKGSPECNPVERSPDVVNAAGEQSHTPSKNNGPPPEATVVDQTRTPVEDSQVPEEVTVEQPRERPLPNPPQEAELDKNETSRDQEDQREHPGAPTADSLPKAAEPSSTAEPSGPSDLHPETILKPISVEPRMNSLAPALTPEEARIGQRAETPPQQHQAALGIVERDTGSEVPSRVPGNVIIHGVIRRRESGDSMGGEQGRTPMEPPAKRIRTELGATTVLAPSMQSSPAATPGALICGPLDPLKSMPWSLMTPTIQRSSSDMILESDTEATPAPRSDKGVADEDAIYDNAVPPFEQHPVPESGPELQMEATPMPPVQDLSLVSPETKPNPFAESMIFLRPPGALPPFVRATMIPDVGSLSLYPHSAYDIHTRSSTIASQAPCQEYPTQQTYVFSAADIRTLVASRGSDEGSGPNKLVFSLDWGFMNGITKWRNFKAGQGPLEGSFCLSLACYPVDSVAPLMSTATDKQPFDTLIRQARIKSSWPSGPGVRSTLKDGSGKSYAIPPFFTTEDNFVDISESAVPGTNSYTIKDNGQSLSSWLFAIYVHTPTVAYFDAVQKRVNKAKKWVETLTSFTAYSLPPVDWDALQSQGPG